MAHCVGASRGTLLPRCQLIKKPTEGLPTPPSSKRRATSYASPAASQGASTNTLPSLPSPSPPPRPVPIIHSTAYLQQTKQLVTVPVPSLANSSSNAALVPAVGSDAAGGRDSSVEENALIWALKKVDDQLDEIEQHPSEVQKAIFDFSTGPVGQATGKGVQVAAKLTMTAGMEAAKVAAPVGKWALQQGFKAAVGLVSYAMEKDKGTKKLTQRNRSSSSSSSKK